MTYITEISSINLGLGDFWPLGCDGVVVPEVLAFLFVQALRGTDAYSDSQALSGGPQRTERQVIKSQSHCFTHLIGDLAAELSMNNVRRICDGCMLECGSLLTILFLLNERKEKG